MPIVLPTTNTNLSAPSLLNTNPMGLDLHQQNLLTQTRNMTDLADDVGLLQDNLDTLTATLGLDSTTEHLDMDTLLKTIGTIPATDHDRQTLLALMNTTTMPSLSTPSSAPVNSVLTSSTNPLISTGTDYLGLGLSNDNSKVAEVLDDDDDGCDVLNQFLK